MKILLPVDGSSAADEAVSFVRTLAQNNPVDVVVLKVSRAPVQHTNEPWISEWTEHESRHAEKVLERVKQKLEVDCQSVSTIHGAGSVVPCIIDQAKESKVDLIAIGAKGLSATQRALLGSVTDTVATRAECSVVVVRPGRERKQLLDRILFAFDKSVASREAAKEVMNLKLDRDTQLSVVSVAQSPRVFLEDGPVPSSIPLTPEQIAPVSEAADRMASHIAERFPQTASYTPVADHIGDAIIEAAEKEGVDLVVVGDTGHNRLGEYFLGSTSRHVLRHAACSVWISRRYRQPIDDSKQQVAGASAAN